MDGHGSQYLSVRGYTKGSFLILRDSRPLRKLTAFCIEFVIFKNFLEQYIKCGMIFYCTAESLQRFRDFVSRCFFNCTLLLNYCYCVSIGLINLATFSATSILRNYIQQPCTWKITLLEVTGKAWSNNYDY